MCDTWVLIASGPSLTPEDVSYCRGKATVVAVNDNYRLAPWADYLYATDFIWWKHHIAAVRATFTGQMLTVDEDAAQQFGIPSVRGVDGAGISRRKDILHTLDNSGAAAFHLPFHKGAKRIGLLGYDMQGEHWFGNHPPEFNAVFNDFPKYLQNFAVLAEDMKAAGIEVVNCSRGTAMTCFPRSTIEEFL